MRPCRRVVDPRALPGYCQASGTMRATSLALCDMAYDPSVAARPSVPASHLRSPWIPPKKATMGEPRETNLP
eukprot:3833202-Prymnesium_polylepis.1